MPKLNVTPAMFASSLVHLLVPSHCDCCVQRSNSLAPHPVEHVEKSTGDAFLRGHTLVSIAEFPWLPQQRDP